MPAGPGLRAGAFVLPIGPVVKICGLTRLEDVLAARDLGVWAVGLVFAPSPRRVEPDIARELLEAAGLGRHDPGSAARASRGTPLAVGVFTDAGPAEIARVVEQVGLDAVQLHGPEGPTTGEVVRAVGGRERTVLVIKAVPVDRDGREPAGLRQAIAQAGEDADVVLLDTRVTRPGAHGRPPARFGGSGAVFRWGQVREAVSGAEGPPLLVAGGICPDNVRCALAESGAWGVDVSSGVESSPGIKDAKATAQLVARVNEVTHR